MAFARYIPGLMAMGAIMAAYKLLGGSDIFDPFSKRTIEDSYDYVIVGGGTSGAVIASRLTEDADTTVLLIEAGGDPRGNVDVDIPIFADHLLGSEMDWQYKTVPQKHSCKSHNDNVAVWTAGKALGGSSTINYMQYLRGSRHDYDDWANSHGASGWSYREVLPYFIKSEDNRNGEYVRTIFHGFGGRLAVQDISVSPVSKITEMAFKEMGVKRRDTNGKTMFGFGQTQATIRNGARCGTFAAFLKRALMRSNLHVLTRATAEKILFEGRKAVGVAFRHDDQQKIVKADKEVILTAGTVGTTKLLLLSGVGPRGHLAQLKIPLVMDLPVGENLQDHVMADATEYYTPYAVSITPAKAENFLSAWAYTLFGTGMKMSPRYREASAFVRTRQQPPHIKYPLIGFHIVAHVGIYGAHQVNVKDQSWEALHHEPPNREGFSVYPVLLHPRSKGTIRLQSSNPEDPPLINPNYLAEDFDIKVLIEAVQYSRKMIHAKVMQDWDFEISTAQLPECAKYGNFTNSYQECYIRHVTLSGNSPVGTCKLGALGDPTAVVDPLLRVRGIKNLRVADASVIPSAMSGNTYATQVMIAEKASDILREKDTVAAIKEYFKHLVQVKHKRIMEDEDHTTTAHADSVKKNANNGAK